LRLGAVGYSGSDCDKPACSNGGDFADVNTYYIANSNARSNADFGADA
jgi:hypothetical protein